MILSIDQGTTGTTCIVYDERAQPLARAYREHRQHFPQPGWVEHDAQEIWETVQGLALAALTQAGARPGELAGIGITNQRETVCVWDPDTGEPLHRAIVWQDRRGAPLCERLREEGREPLIRERTGLVLDPYFSATKISWLLENVPDLRARARVRAPARGAVFGTIDSWLIFKLTGQHLTDATNASRTLLYDIAAGRWDPELLDLFGIPAESLPEVRPSTGPFAACLADVLDGHTAVRGGRAVPVAGVAGDQQAALFGQACLEPGQGKNTYGTGSFVLLNTGSTPPTPAPGLLSTVAWRTGAGTMDGGTTYALEASIFATGAAVQWLRDGLQIIADAGETEALAASLQANDGVYFVPALTGLGSPHWDPHARGTIVGLTRGAGRAHLARATLEAIAYQTVDAVRAMEFAAGRPLGELRVDGGGSANGWLMQFQADVLGAPVLLGHTVESTAFGAGLLAGVGAGAWGVADVPSLWRERGRYEPRMSDEEREQLLRGWADALERTRSR
jgi:glycerol kinase